MIILGEVNYSAISIRVGMVNSTSNPNILYTIQEHVDDTKHYVPSLTHTDWLFLSLEKFYQSYYATELQQRDVEFLKYMHWDLLAPAGTE